MAAELPVTVPHESVNDDSVKLVAWLVADGEVVSAGQPVAEVEGSKATFPVPSPHAGTVRLRAAVGDEVAVGAALCVVVVAGGVEAKAPSKNGSHAAVSPPPVAVPVLASGGGHPPDSDPARAVVENPQGGDPPPTPHQTTQRFSAAAQALVKQHGLDAALFRDLPLVRAADVQAKLAPPRTTTTEPAAFAAPAKAAAAYETVPLSRQKQTENRYLRDGGANVIPSQVSVLVPTGGLKDALAADPDGLSLTALAVFEAGRLLARYPELNGFYADRAHARYTDINIGFAVAGEFGLKVPVVRAADTKSAGAIAEEVRGLLAAYAENKLTPDQLAGGTFTVSDLSGEGIFALNPLIVKGQAAILGVGAEARLAPGGGAVFSLTLSFDHQLADGLLAARFLAELGERLRHHESSLRRRGAGAPRCEKCGRTVGEVRALTGHLMQTVNDDGDPARVCSLCVAGF
ncbi:MAG: 2-oxo acid dehydrogenase subunit E2 [Gemmataceae bacterium]|nr:2-oxo acid dehydrogenase subunit E2 [Gemmataceae bacterium]